VFYGLFVTSEAQTNYKKTYDFTNRNFEILFGGLFNVSIKFFGGVEISGRFSVDFWDFPRFFTAFFLQLYSRGF
jgi:hypothetical protein